MDKDRGPFFSNPFVARAARWGLLAWSLIGILILLYAVSRYVLRPIEIIFPPLVVALVVIYLLNPLVTRLQERGVPRVWGTLLCYVVFLSLTGLALAYFVPVLTHQVKAFVSGIPALLQRAESGLVVFSNRLGVHIDPNAFFRSFEPGQGGFNFLGRITSFTSGVVHVALVVVLGPLLAFYLLVDLPKIQRVSTALVPAPRREEVRGLAGTLADTLGGFFRGQLLVALLVGAFCVGGFYVVGLPYFVLIGALTALLALVPLIGLVIAAVPVLFVAFTTSGRTGGVLHISGGWRLALACSVILLVAQQLDLRVLSPRLLSRTVRLHPVTVLLSLLVGGTLQGLWGMLLAVPAAAALKVLLLHVWDTRAQWPPRRAPAASVPASASEPVAAAEPRPEAAPPADGHRLPDRSGRPGRAGGRDPARSAQAD
jgi:predicted PurR-regulated permease PerM